MLGCALQVAKQLADCVIPNEYGIDPGSKIRIGSKICCALLGKLLADLSNMQEESIATAVRCAVLARWPCPAVVMVSVLCSMLPNAARLSLCMPVLAAAVFTKQHGLTMITERRMAPVTSHKQQSPAMLADDSVAPVD